MNSCLEEALKFAIERGVTSEDQLKIVVAEFNYGKHTYTMNTPYKGLVTKELQENADLAGLLQVQDYVNTICRRNRI